MTKVHVTAALQPAASTIDLAAIDTRSTPGFAGNKSDGERELAAGTAELSELQEKLFAESTAGGTRSLLLVLQAMDTAGKGGIVQHVFAGTSPHGLRAVAFKAPTEEEKQHDFLWRIRRELPAPGHVAVFDRSHYEDVLVHRVRSLSTPVEIEKRYGQITDFEAELAASGTAVIKVMLHISPGEQKERLTARLNTPDKQWKFNPGDLDDRALWPAFQEAYQIAISRTSTADAPWFVVPADRKWYARVAVQRLVTERLRAMNLAWPAPDYNVDEQKARLAAD